MMIHEQGAFGVPPGCLLENPLTTHNPEVDDLLVKNTLTSFVEFSAHDFCYYIQIWCTNFAIRVYLAYSC